MPSLILCLYLWCKHLGLLAFPQIHHVTLLLHPGLLHFLGTKLSTPMFSLLPIIRAPVWRKGFLGTSSTVDLKYACFTTSLISQPTPVSPVGLSDPWRRERCPIFFHRPVVGLKRPARLISDQTKSCVYKYITSGKTRQNDGDDY